MHEPPKHFPELIFFTGDLKIIIEKVLKFQTENIYPIIKKNIKVVKRNNSYRKTFESHHIYSYTSFTQNF